MRSTIATGMLVGILAGFATEAKAEVPFFNATCPGRIEVHADQGGPVFINGSQARLKRSAAIITRRAKDEPRSRSASTAMVRLQSAIRAGAPATASAVSRLPAATHGHARNARRNTTTRSSRIVSTQG
ncbi:MULTISPECIES: hypothetical protein [unclassified Ensifer]|uniref:hypothetical protein n=1 Tax=unclassified Ensifer TaxID=2633371 RepID=UPI001AEE5E58|nr:MULTISPECIES: hypothetical protein [unclassified Ensifer]